MIMHVHNSLSEINVYNSVQGGEGGSDTFAYIWFSGFILRLTVKVILDKS